MPNDGMLLVNFGSLQQAGADIQKAVSTLQTKLDEIEAAAAPLVESWDGEAKAAYHQRQATWRAAANDLTTILQNIKGAVDRSAEDYISTEKQATQRFQ
ncbi:WXG100 family type VII secretion target [Actinoplanes sp. URMC 104]|uniref:WXG100 family type VII secretion target n=1 Tax=Actinoplanes sp. URMC 104 TaxID=3423409 RepID=UPI003F1A7AF6